MGDPRGALGRADRRLPARGDRGPRARRLRGDRARDGRRRELQQRVGGARRAGLGDALRRPSAVRPPHRRLRRVRDRLEGRRGRHALEARRRGRRSTATRPPTRTPRCTASTRSPRPRSRSGATRRRGARSRSSPRCRRSSCCRSRRTSLGGGRLLRPHLLHRLPHADGPGEAAAGPPRAHLGRGRRPRRVRDAAVQDRGRAVGRRGVLARRRASWSSSSARSTTSTATSSRG